MSKLSRTGLQVVLGFSFAVLVSAAVGVTAFVTARGISRQLDEVAGSELPGAIALMEIDTAIMQATRGMNGILSERIYADPEMHAAIFKMGDESIASIEELRKAYAALPHAENDLADWRALQPPLEGWLEAARAFMQIAREREQSGRSDAIDARLWDAYQGVRKAYLAVGKPLHEMVKQVSRDAAELRETSAKEVSSGMTLIAVTVALGAALVLALGFLLARRIGKAIGTLTGEAARLREAVEQGRLDVRGDSASLDPEFRPIIEGTNEMMEAFVAPIRVTADYVARISRGDVPPRLTQAYRGDFNVTKDNLNAAIDAIEALVADTKRLAAAGVDGKLSVRADAARHHGDFRKVVEGVNATLDAVIAPLEDAARCVDGIAKGAVPPPITAAYRGDFEVLKQNLNGCIAAVNALVADAAALSAAALEGRLATRADVSRHQGDFRKVVEGVNATLDAVIKPLEDAARCVDGIAKGAVPPPITAEYRGDFDLLKRNLNGCIDAVNALVADSNRLAEAAVAGQLQTRADATRHQGDFRRIVDGVNRTLDAILAPVAEAAKVLEQLAARDLRARVTGAYQGDHARIQESVNATAEALHGALAQVASAVEQVSSASAQIAASSQAVASGASEQAASLQETSASLESVGSMTKHSADSAQHANQLALAARTAATEGSASVEQMQAAMGKIKASAEGTSQIIKDVSDIAFQTNLLALNAAVEAARAGEAGRGFAVVAEEVRSLALRAKDAAQKTEELIRQSVKEAAEGAVAAQHVAGKLGEIVGGVAKVTDIVAEIASAAKEQSSGIGQVEKAVSEMDKVTQQNAASAEESSSAASELNGQAEELAAMVAGFRLERGPAALRAARPAARLPARPAPAARRPAAAPARDAFPMDAAEARDF
ncbi:MAG: methyl-accepting chemotaxis protein [Anaeromyxobacter sp.]